jgi:acyl dehydratase
MIERMNKRMSKRMTIDQPALVEVGDSCTRRLNFSRAQIADFARLTGDDNPLHHDLEAARRARHRDIIASGQQTSAQLMGLAATHFSRTDAAGARDLLCLNFNFAFKAPVFADVDVDLSWAAANVEWQTGLAGWVVQIEGQARAAESLCVIGRGTLLVRPAGR